MTSETRNRSVVLGAIVLCSAGLGALAGYGNGWRHGYSSGYATGRQDAKATQEAVWNDMRKMGVCDYAANLNRVAQCMRAER